MALEQTSCLIIVFLVLEHSAFAVKGPGKVIYIIYMNHLTYAPTLHLKSHFDMPKRKMRG